MGHMGSTVDVGNLAPLRNPKNTVNINGITYIRLCQISSIQSSEPSNPKILDYQPALLQNKK